MTELLNFMFEQTLRDKIINIINDTLEIDKPHKVEDDNEVVAELCDYAKTLLHKVETAANEEGESEQDIIHHLLDVAISNQALVVLLRKYIEFLHNKYGIEPEPEEEN